MSHHLTGCHGLLGNADLYLCQTLIMFTRSLRINNIQYFARFVIVNRKDISNPLFTNVIRHLTLALSGHLGALSGAALWCQQERCGTEGSG